MTGRVIVASTTTGTELWSHDLTGQPLIDYVPAQAFRLEDSGEATITVEDK